MGMILDDAAGYSVSDAVGLVLAGHCATMPVERDTVWWVGDTVYSELATALWDRLLFGRRCCSTTLRH